MAIMETDSSLLLGETQEPAQASAQAPAQAPAQASAQALTQAPAQARVAKPSATTSLHPNHPCHPNQGGNGVPPQESYPDGQSQRRTNTQPQGRAVNDQSNNQNSRSANNQAATKTEKPPFVKPARQYHVYGKKQAFEIRSTTNRKDVNTVVFDFANKLRNSDNFDWDNNLMFQLTPSELIEFCAIMLGVIPEATWSFHDGKSMIVRWKEDGNILFSCMKSQQSFTVAVVSISDRVNVMNTGLYALAAEQKISITEARLQVSAMCRMINPLTQKPLRASVKTQ